MLVRRRPVRLFTDRMILRPPRHSDFRPWMELRKASRAFLTPWEPAWSHDHLTRKAFSDRVYWAQRSISDGHAVPLFLIRRDDETLLGAVTLENIRQGPAQAGTLGYWIGEPYARRGYMREAIDAVVHYGFAVRDLSRMEAACLPENVASRRVFWKRPGSNTKGSHRVICRSTAGGETMFSMPICARIGAAGPMWDSRSRAPAPLYRTGCRGEMIVRSRVPRIPIDCPPPGDSTTVVRLRFRDHDVYASPTVRRRCPVPLPLVVDCRAASMAST